MMFVNVRSITSHVFFYKYKLGLMIFVGRFHITSALPFSDGYCTLGYKSNINVFKDAKLKHTAVLITFVHISHIQPYVNYLIAMYTSSAVVNDLISCHYCCTITCSQIHTQYDHFGAFSR